jgi:hypothetical protein
MEFWIAGKAYTWLAYAWIKRIPPTALPRSIWRLLVQKDELDLMEGLSRG